MLQPNHSWHKNNLTFIHFLLSDFGWVARANFHSQDFCGPVFAVIFSRQFFAVKFLRSSFCDQEHS